MCVCVYVCRVCVYNSLYFFFSFFFYQFVFTYHAKNLLATSSLEHLSLGVYIHIYLSTKQSRYATIRTPVVFFFLHFLYTECETLDRGIRWRLRDAREQRILIQTDDDGSIRKKRRAFVRAARIG